MKHEIKLFFGENRAIDVLKANASFVGVGREMQSPQRKFQKNQLTTMKEFEKKI